MHGHRDAACKVGQQPGCSPTQVRGTRGAGRRGRYGGRVGQERYDRGSAESSDLFLGAARRQDHGSEWPQGERLGHTDRQRGVVSRRYVPDAGDLVWLTFDPQVGHEQRGRRPALILSPRSYNSKACLTIACQITSHVKGYPFEVALPPGGKISGVVLANHVKTLAWQARRVVFEAKAPDDIVTDVRERLRVLLGL